MKRAAIWLAASLAGVAVGALLVNAAQAKVIDVPQTCVGILEMSSEGAADENGYIIDARQLKPDASNKSLHCDIAVLSGKELRKVLKVCQNGDRCLIKGAFSGHGNFFWTRIDKVVRLSLCRRCHDNA